MSAAFVALIFGVGVAAFVWSKLSQSTGNARPTNVAIGAGIAGFIAFLVLFVTAKLVFGA
jgi:hypothetical protein